MRKNQGFVLPLVILAVLALAVGGFYLLKLRTGNIFNVTSKLNLLNTSSATPTLLPAATLPPDSTQNIPANWRIYQNTEYKFEFKYPQDWKITENPFSNVYSDVLKNKFPYTIDVVGNAGNIESATLMFNPEGCYSGNCTNPEAKKEQTVLNGMNIFKYSFVNNAGHLVVTYMGFGIKGLPNFLIDINYPKKDEEVVNQILSTFKFIY